jgi:hypothetical protein
MLVETCGVHTPVKQKSLTFKTFKGFKKQVASETDNNQRE